MNEDRIWEMYYSEQAYQAVTRDACRERIGWFIENAGGRVLDIGCSQGLVPILLGRAGHNVVGVDVEAQSIEFAKQRLAEEPPEVRARVELFLADAHEWDPPGGTRFDTIMMGEVLEHLSDPKGLVTAARRLAVDGARLVVTVPMGWLEHHDHRQEFLPETLVALLAPEFGVASLDVIDDKIRLTAVAGAESRAEAVAPTRLARLVAISLLELQHKRGAADQSAHQRAGELMSRAEKRKAHERQVAKLERRIAELKAKTDKLAADKKKLRSSASYQLGSMIVGVGMQPRTALALPRRLASLAWTSLREQGLPGMRRSPVAPRGPSPKDVYDGSFKVTLAGARPLIDPVAGRILHLLEYSLPHTQNGYTLRSFQIVQAQKQHGWDPVVVTRPGFPDGVDACGPETVAGVPHYRLTGKRLEGDTDNLCRYIEAFAAEVAPILEEVRPSLVHAGSNFRNAYPALELARNYHLPFVYEVRGLWEETRVANGTLSREDAKYDNLVGVEAFCARSADAVVTLGAGLKQALVERGIAAEKIFLVPNAVEAPLHLPSPDPALVESLGLGGRFLVSYIGSVSPLESLHVLVEAMWNIRQRGRQDIGAVIVGDGAALEDLRTLAERLGVADCVRFVGSVAHHEVREYYAISGAIACTRGRDRVCSVVTPLKPYEAMAYAKPVIVSDIPALREMVTDRVTGRLVRPEDPAALARVIEELADDPTGCRELGARASAWVREHRTWARVTEGYRPAYQYAHEAFARRTRGGVRP